MKIEISIRNGSGWNNYAGLRDLTTLRPGTRGLARKNNVFRIEVGPADAERPLGIAARYYDEGDDLTFTQYFDQNDSAAHIEDRINWLLEEGIEVRKARRAREIARTDFTSRVTAWRRNFDPAGKSNRSAMALRAKIGAWREQSGRFSRKDCWAFTDAIRAGSMTFAQVRALFFPAA